MTPEQFTATVRGWGRAFRDLAQDVLPKRDAWIWTWGFRVGAALLAVAYMPGVLPEGWSEQIIHWNGVVTIVAAKMGWSWAGSPDSQPETGE